MYWEIDNAATYKVALYIRLSKEDDSENESQSVTNQRSMLLTFAEQHGFKIQDIYIDDGFSGTSFDRPDFKRMIADIEQNKINLVMTKDLSRLGRDYIQTGYYMEKYFPEKQVRYISLLDGIDTGVDSTINDITPFRAIMNDMYAKDISKKIKSVKHDKQKKGLFIGGKAPYGYKMSPDQKNVIVIDEKAAEVVRKIFERAVNGMSCHQIAMKLNEECIDTPAVYAHINLSSKSPYSGKWSAERIAFMLKNRVYVGDMVQGRIKKVNYKSKKCIKMPPGEWIVSPNTHEAIIDSDIFEKVQLLLGSRKQTRSRTYEYPLKGLIFCHECGYPLAVIKRTLAGNRDTLYFICRTYQRFTKLNCCTCHTVREEYVEEAVMEKVTEIVHEYVSQKELSEMAVCELRRFFDLKNSQEHKIRDLKNQIHTMMTQMDESYRDKLSGLLDEGDFERVYQQMKTERSKLEEQVKSLEKMTDSSQDWETAKSHELVQRFMDTIESNKGLLVSLVKRVELTQHKKVLIYFAFQYPHA